MPRVLVADDEPSVRRVLADYLRRDGYTVLEAADGPAARRVLTERPVDLAVLDISMPGESGLDLCRWLQANARTPVIFLTARAEETDRLIGLELGADDYVTKPFSPREVVARVRTVLRRAQTGTTVIDPPFVTAGEITLDVRTRDVRVRGAEVVLTAREFDLLLFLARHPRQVFSREQILDRVWGYPTGTAAAATATVTVHVRRLREKIELSASAPRLLQTVHGVGYRLVP